MTRPLPLTFPLHGSRLIEASAGTGKTFTLAALYVRLVLGHGGDAAFSRPLLPPEILVVTFTEAATEELRERIRDRLAEAARVFASPADFPADPILQGLLDDYPQPEQRQACAHRLAAAAQWMDEAAIYTIHGFCNRMLRQHAFDSGSLFTLELNEDASDEQYQAACDYWRTVIAGFPTSAALALRAGHLDSPDALLAGCRPLLGHTDADPTQLPAAVNQWLALNEDQQRHEQRARELLGHELPALRQWVAQAQRHKWLNGNSYRDASVPLMLAALERYAQGFPATDPDHRKALERFSASGLKLTKAGAGQHPDLLCLAALDQVLAGRERAALPRAALLGHAAAWIGQRLARQRRQSATMSFDDMLQRLHDALHGANGARLAEVIRNQYPVALIDEFQDTDPTQYGIFAALYDAQEGVGWFMIGDPKQAIYAFRGADVYTYLRARQATEGRHYSLDRNFRSATAMVDAVNHLFGQAQARFGDVFLLDGAIPFAAVSAAGRADVLIVDEAPTAGATLWVESGEQAISSGVYRHRQAQRAATHIAHLLNGAERGVTGFHRDGERTPLRPRDIAVLVRDRNEAAAIRAALRARNVRSVYLSDQDSVFATEQASDLLLLLRACAAPESDLRVRSALACATLAVPYGELDQINHDEQRWEQELARFHRYKLHWQRRGVLAMLRGLLLDFQVPARLSRDLDGERALTNLLHLAEWLQQAATRLDGEQALIRHLQEVLEQDRPASDDAILRLESDDDRVKVVTIHKSKGLEYPLVFLPFICGFRPAEKSKPPLRYHRDGELVVDLEPDDTATARADQERLAEDMRLLYVALTRARHACWLGLAPFTRGRGNRNQLHHGAIGRLLFGPEGVTNDAVLTQLAPLANAAVNVIPAPEPDDHPYRPHHVEPPWRGAARLQRRPREPWWIASYSALRQVQESLAPADPRGDRLAEQEPAETPATTPRPGSLHTFPRGALPGTVLHEILEAAARDGFQATLAAPAELDQRVRDMLAARHWQDHAEIVNAWWRRILTTALPLGEDTVALADLQRPVAELEFLFPARAVKVARLDELIRQHIAAGVPRPQLEADTLNGMVKGFIDLVFEHQGRYYVLDYKSNWLGADEHAYTDDAMQAAILEKRYEVQYVLYLLALHRLLSSRLGERYQPQRHLGGALYVFLRGIDATTAGSVFTPAPVALIEALDRLFVPATEPADAS